ncbi:hypothetical protein [Blastopirellula marina]|uniref:Uncharacterized protein n=1 Tax=Blastopirellula marina TaxID=124 RepID=A0A2S8FHS8_9BACT|nr:hypothetical protein [Blastopirellula marina]PQO31726.1 hypothetical protein C5Y98_20150 [Blastopirellula marina]PTL43033.1 hypothetical protein C5Y97_20160 [Blastopirellula marina]
MSLSDQQRNAIDRWRKRQIYCVAAGNVAAIVFLIGVALNWLSLVGSGAIAFVVCLAGILGAGVITSRIARSSV